VVALAVRNFYNAAPAGSVTGLTQQDTEVAPQALALGAGHQPTAGQDRDSWQISDYDHGLQESLGMLSTE
jgi:hypothetical protein